MRRRRQFQVQVLPVPDPAAGAHYDALIEQVGEGLAQHLLGVPPAAEPDQPHNAVERVLSRHRREP